jgi:hypothetical protein
MKKDVVFIDDEIKEGSGFANDLKNIVEECGLSLKVLNTKEEIDSFVGETSCNTGLLLLDRDLSKIKCKPKITAKKILTGLANRKIPKFILSQHKPGEEVDDDFKTLYKLGVVDYIQKTKTDTEINTTLFDEVFMKNLIYSAVNDPNNKRFKLVIDCKDASIMLSEKNLETGIETGIDENIDYGDIGGTWKVAQEIPSYTNKARSSKEIIMRILYEMGKRNKTGISIKSIYLPFPNNDDKISLNKTEAEKLCELNIKLNDYLLEKKEVGLNIDDTMCKLKNLKEAINEILDEIYEREDNREMRKGRKTKKLHVVHINNLLSNLRGFDDVKMTNYADEIAEVLSGKITLPGKFSDNRIKFNNKIKEISKGRVLGSVLMGTKGSSDFIYTARIGKVELINSGLDEDEPSGSWKEIIEKRLEAIEKEIAELKDRK